MRLRPDHIFYIQSLGGAGVPAYHGKVGRGWTPISSARVRCVSLKKKHFQARSSLSSLQLSDLCGFVSRHREVPGFHKPNYLTSVQQGNNPRLSPLLVVRSNPTCDRVHAMESQPGRQRKSTLLLRKDFLRHGTKKPTHPHSPVKGLCGNYPSPPPGNPTPGGGSRLQFADRNISGGRVSPPGAEGRFFFFFFL